MKKTKLLLSIVLLISLWIPLGGSKVHASNTFTDISQNHRAYNEITYLATGDIVSGSLNGRFNPNDLVTRDQAAAMIGRALELNGQQRPTEFKDVGSGNFASGYIQSAVDKKILSGYGGGIFRPAAVVSRGEMAVMISKAFGYEFGGTLSGAANALMSIGIAQGMTNGSFGADHSLTRMDFSIFLARAINPKLRVNSSVTFSNELFVTSSSLNVRSGPTTKYPVVASVANGASVKSAHKVGNWIYIQTGAKEGFVSGSYVSSSVDAPPASSPLADKTIVIDPGHGGTDPGAVGFGLYEKTVVLDTALKVKQLLKQTPFDVQLTREKDVYISKDNRSAFANNLKADIFVSIHANSVNDSSANGTETYYYKSAATNTRITESAELAKAIQARLIEAWNLRDREVKTAEYVVLKKTNMPAVLAELGFISNASDNEKLASPSWRQKAADAIFLGILDYYKGNGYDVKKYYNLVE
ncbi:N-acetylmuramoyl-L-alanine amidase [Peribacillus sp. NPDC096379]|uniref:N-acetylmuramoyl-L-alanine amidase n=1 Tax=Peribacillus sp. NPDC096379 TaxID=3364393 RepID=UPI003824B098